MKTAKFFTLILAFFVFGRVKAQNNTIAINRVLQNYFDVEKALANDDGKMANKGAKEMAGAIAKVNAAQLDAAQKTAWTTYSEKLRYNSQHISESKSIDHQREHFASLSDEMFGLLKTFKTHPTVYQQYCPMKKQYWLNETQKIQNPYYGKEMPDCGKVTETLTGTASAVLTR